MLDLRAWVPAEATAFDASAAVLALKDGTHVDGSATARVTRSAIVIAFEAVEPYALPPARYGDATGSLASVDGRTKAPRVSAGPVEGAFDAPLLHIAGASNEPVATTRVVLAGAAFDAPERDGIRVALLTEGSNHHDRRLTIEAGGDLDDAAIEDLGRSAGFVSGIDLEVLSVVRADASGATVATEYRRGLRRVGRYPHSPFTGVDPAHRAAAFHAVARRLRTGTPDDEALRIILDQITASNHVAQIHLSAQLLLLATTTMAYASRHGAVVDGGAASRRPELAQLDARLHLGLGATDLDRFEQLRVELLDAGFFHAPGYETGRPQRDIKFLRDVAHRIVFRMAGYDGPYYNSERFAVEEVPA